MSGRTLIRIIASAVLLGSAAFTAKSQAFTSYTPYSIFGVGDIADPGTAYNRSMGGVGIAGRSNRFMNVLNPAAVTARDSLAFMADFTVSGGSRFFTQGDMSSISNTFNISNCSISFPIWKSSAMMVGIQPYSSTGYGYSFAYDDPSIIGRTGPVKYSATGQGALYNAFVAAGVTFFKRISFGAQASYIFGQTDKNYYGTFSDSSFNGVKNGNSLQLSGVTGKFGIQYEQPVGTKGSLTVGATYQLETDIKGYVENYSFSSGTAASDTLYYRVDTLANRPDRVRLAGEIGVGISYKHADKWMVEFDYTRSDWTRSGLGNVEGFRGNTSSSSSSSVFTTSISDSYRVGFEYVPNRNDIRYFYKKIAYRGGAYYRNEYYLLDGNKVNSMGITIGATIPVFRWYNGLTIAVDFGQRGTICDNMIRERYINFSVGMNIFDIWFQKPRYE